MRVCFAEVGEPEPVVIVQGKKRLKKSLHEILFAPARVLSAPWICSFLFFVLMCISVKGQGTNVHSYVIEAAGRVEYATSGLTNWQSATNGLALSAGDRIRTRAQSRAAIQLSDRSVVRLNENTTLEILPPRNAEKKRFGLPRGSIFFFDREKPSDVEFDTPLAAGAIRGTEFLLEVAEADQGLHLALLDGFVALRTADGEVSMQRGEDLQLTPGKPPQKTAIVNATAIIQWALYYPAVLDPADLQLNAADSMALTEVMKNYVAGDLLGALSKWPENFPASGTGAAALRAQLLLAVGRVNEAEQLLSGLPSEATSVVALREMIAVVRGESVSALKSPQTVSECLTRSYALQGTAELEGARVAARHAVEFAPHLGFARARLAELEFAFGRRREAMEQLKLAFEYSPRLVPAYTLQGFVLLEQGKPHAALASFDQARDLDAAFGPAWLGRGLCLMHGRDFFGARAAFQAAAALEPQRSLFRSYLGKATSELGDSIAAEKELRLAKELDANDATAWLYSALHLWQENRINEALRDLEKSSDLNDNRAAFRSQLLLDDDRSVRSANLAAIYDDAGLPDVSRHVASRSVAESYANFSGHLFLANSLQSQESAIRFDLRLESARQSELLTANLLAPPGAGNLSQFLSQSEHLRFFGEKPVGLSTVSEYGSNGDWRQAATAFGSYDGFSYALDASYQSLNGEQSNGGLESRQFIFTAKQRVTTDDDLYFQVGTYHADAGDVADFYSPAQAKPGFHASEEQLPTLYAGWHHAWSPGSHTLVLLSRLDDRLTSHDPDKSFLFLQTGFFTDDIIAAAQGTLPPTPLGEGPLISDFASDFTLYSVELQQIWQTERNSLVLGGRWQSGNVDTHSTMSDGPFAVPFLVTDEHARNSLVRGDVYAYGTWQVTQALQLIGGASYSRISFPKNADAPPLARGETSRDLVSPKVGVLFQPWNRGLFRASYTKSLGGLYFDNSVRLEPTQVGGFNQAFRSLIPESVAGLVPGTEFETISAGFDQSFTSGTFFGIEAEQLSSHGTRDVGAFKSFAELLMEDTATSTRDELDFRERNLSAYAGQLLGESFSFASRYRVSQARLVENFPDIPNAALGLNDLERRNTALMHNVSLTLNFNHRSGVFAQWESAWYHQNNSGYTPSLAGEDFWQHNILAGYRFPRRQAEIRIGLLNLTDADYRLNPLNLHADLPRGRTVAVSLRLNF